MSVGMAAWLAVAAGLAAWQAGRDRLALDSALAYSRPIAGRLGSAIGPLAELYEALGAHTPPEAVIVDPLLFESPDPVHQTVLGFALGLRRFALPREIVLLESATWPAAAAAASERAPVYVLDTLGLVEPQPLLEHVATGTGFVLWRYTPTAQGRRDG